MVLGSTSRLRGDWVPHIFASAKCGSESDDLPVHWFDLHEANFSVTIEPEAAPLPVLGGRDQLPFDRVAMHVTQLFDPLLGGTHVEVIEPLLPEMGLLV